MFRLSSILALLPNAQRMPDGYAAGIQKLWSSTLSDESEELPRAVDDAVLTLWLLRTKQPTWNALQELSFYSHVVVLKPAQRARVRLFVEELWLSTTFEGAMDDLARLTRSGPEAGAFVDERRRFRRYAPKDWCDYFSTLGGKEVRRYVHSRIPVRSADVSMPLQQNVTNAPSRPTVASPLRQSTSRMTVEA